MELIPHRLTPDERHPGIRSLVGFGTGPPALAHPVLYHPGAWRRGCTSMHFGENQLSPGSIGISPLPTAHPLVFQHQWVRASTRG